MAICDLSTSITRLQRATSDLREQWLTAKEHWNDATNDRFERDYLNPLAPPISGTLAALHGFAELLQQAEKECGDEHLLE
ncbi:MAG: hypothetical protein KDA55_23830 [Planctomycetales bacterium]|nr:hypothetical protein [Planctomycetales bacterium]